MPKLKDLTGKRFGLLTAKVRAGSSKQGQALWLCDCDCGNEVVVRGGSLTSGNTTSCGCKNKRRFDDEVQKIIGQKFGRLTVVSRAENYTPPNGSTRSMLNCKCDCGNEIVAERQSVVSGHTKSCGCLQREVNTARCTKHGMSGTSIYHTWENMIGRCYNKSLPNYHRYGGRGIVVCDEWRQFENFYEYVSKLPHYGEKGYSLDRIDNDGNYEPDNIRWANDETQSNNKSTNHYLTYDGKTQTITQWAKEINMNPRALADRIYNGWTVERALSTPVQNK